MISIQQGAPKGVLGGIPPFFSEVSVDIFENCFLVSEGPGSLMSVYQHLDILLQSFSVKGMAHGRTGKKRCSSKEEMYQTMMDRKSSKTLAH